MECSTEWQIIPKCKSSRLAQELYIYIYIYTYRYIDIYMYTYRDIYIYIYFFFFLIKKLELVAVVADVQILDTPRYTLYTLELTCKFGFT